MTRGNQRDLARAKNAKKQEQLKRAHGHKSGDVSTSKRMDSDADIMRKKQQQALDKKAAEAQTQNANKVVKNDPLKDL